MKKLYTLFLLFIAINVSKAGIIASDNFENTTNSCGCDWFSGNTVYIFSGNSNSSTDVPGSVPKYSSGAQSSGRTNGVGSYLSPTVDVSACSNLSMSFDLAAMSLGSTGNGMDWNGSTSDRVYIEISTNSGTSWSKELEIRGTNATNTTSNFYWKFSTIANPSYSYDGDNTATVIAPDNTNTTKDRFSVGDGYSKITINGLPSSNQLKIKITLQTNANNETWLIDNFVLSGDCGAVPIMEVRGGSPITNIADGDATPSTTDSTIFKNTCIGSSSTVTYTIRNTGTATLNLTGSPLVKLGGTNASDFSLTTAPASTVAAGDSTKFTVQFTPGAAGTRNATISIPNDDPGTAKNPYNYSIQGTSGPPTISSEPSDQSVVVGNTATFTLTAANGSLTYQWQVSTNGGTIWNDVSTGTGGTTNSYTTPTTTQAMNGYKYKCIVTNSCGNATSNVVTLFVNCFNESFTSTGFPYTGWENVDAFATRITSNFKTTPACMSLDIGYLGEIRLPKVNRPSSLSFWLSRSSSNAQNELIIQVSTVNQKTGYVQVASYTDADMASANTYYQKTIDLTAFSDYDAVFVNFVSLGTDPVSTTVYRVDDIQFTCSASTCTTPQNVPGAHGNPGNASAMLNWYYPACFDEIMIVANTTAGINFTPSGNGSAYTPNSVYGGVNSIVYKGTGTSQTVTGLTNGTTYYFEIFTRKGSNWSSGYEIKVTPVASPTHCLSDFLDISDEFISKVQVANINNPSYVYDGYADYTYIQSDVERSLDYPITVDNGQDFDGDYCYVWVDWNHDGTFSNTVGTPTGAGERYVMTGVGGGTAQFTGTITPPTGALDGLARMRVTLVYDETTPSAADCSTTLGYGETEDYMLNVLAPCVPDFTVSNFYPKSGTAESWIRITGTNLTNVTYISINGVAVTNYQKSATEIRMELPAGATTGKIMLSNAANCKVLTSVPFTVVSPDNGSCSSGGATNLFISELYDPGSGNNHYIEIYNGTGGSVNLSGYSLQVVNISATGTFPGTSYILSGTLAANATEIVWAGNAGSLATQGGPTNGFNADDEIRLYQGASVIDRITCPTVSGYSMIRVPSVMSPSSSYVGAQWNILTNPNQSTANIGLHTFNGTSPLTITTLPTDQTVAPCDAATFSFNVSGSGVTFQWVVNDMTTDTWSNVTTGGAYTVNNTSNSTSLVVNPMAFKDSFQFYCIVTSGSCIKYVRAVQLYEGVNNKPVFRSVSTSDSNWTTVANWEVATSESGPWTPACVYPKAENSTRVIISNNTYIKLNFQNDVDSLEVQLNGVLELNPGSRITINNGFSSGADYIINGTLYDNTDNSTVFNSGATWLLGDTAKVIKSRNSSTNVYRDNYQGGIANIPATAHWKIRYVGASQPSVSSIGMYYPNLYWENYTGSHVNLNNSSSTMRGGSGYATVKGSMYVGSTGVSSLSVYNNNYNAQPMLILGNLEVASNSILTTNSYNGSENEGTGFELQGDVTINGSLLIIYNSVYPTSSKLLKFSGNKSPQNLSGSGLLYLHNVEIAKSGSQYVKLNRSVNVRRNLNMNGGHFVLDVDTLKSLYSLDVLELGENAIDVGTLTISKPNSFVIGRMRRWYVAAVSSGDASSLFPIGANDTLRHIGYPDAIMNRNIKVEFTEAPSVGGALDVFFMQKDMTVSGMPIHINPFGGCTSFDAYFTENQGYWKVIPTVTLVDYKYTITAIGEGFTTIDPSSLCNLTLLKRPDNTSTWYSLGTHEEPAGTITKPILKRSGLTSFSDFGYAGGILNILPIELESFTGTCENDYIRLDWATASEYDNDYFVVEKSFDQITYIPMDTIDGAGTSNQILYYSSKDLETVPAYYRIRQVDYDGSSTLSSVIWLNCESGNLDGVQVYFDGNLINALISATNNKSYIANIYNAKGQIVYSENFNIQKGISKVPMQHNKLASGIYIVNLYDGTRQFTQKIFVK